jgi:NADPH:quinone reductase-like Zn-dependent oxidoreductase
MKLLVRIRATTVTAGDYRARSLDMPSGFGLVGRLVFGLSGPAARVLGTEFSGVVEAVGSEVTRFAPGDRVFAYPGAGFGGYAEYAVIAQRPGRLPRMPANLDFDEAAALLLRRRDGAQFPARQGRHQAGRQGSW